MRREYVGGAQSARLSVGLGGTTSDLTISCTDLTNWPTGAGGRPFYIVIDRGTSSEEKILCSSRSGNTLTVYSVGLDNGRGADDTNITAHSANAVVEHVFTATDADEANAHIYDTNAGAHPQYLQKAAPINTRSDSYTLALSDAGGVVEMNKATDQTLTIPLDASVDFPIGTRVEVIQSGAGDTTIVAPAGVTINSIGGLTKIDSQWGSVSLIKRAANSWILNGPLKPAVAPLAWTARTSVLSTTYDFAAGGGTVIGTGPSGTLASSTDGITWTLRTSSFSGSDTIYAAGFGNGLFLAGGSNLKIATSPDGSTWTQRTVGFGSAGDIILAITYANGVYVFGSVFGEIGTSTNGTTWTQRTSPFRSVPAGIRSIAYGAGLFVAVGDFGLLATSPDAVTWTSRTSSFGSSQITKVAFANNVFVAVGASGKIATSSDGITWTQRSSGFGTSGLQSVAYNNGRFVATGTSQMQSSTDGISWANEATPFSGITTIKSGLNLFFASGGASLATSP